MNISMLEDIFGITHYQLCSQSASIELINGSIVVHTYYRFLNSNGEQVGPVTPVTMVVTQEQSNELKMILAQILQVTNDTIESSTGWLKKEA